MATAIGERPPMALGTPEYDAWLRRWMDDPVTREWAIRDQGDRAWRWSVVKSIHVGWIVTAPVPCWLDHRCINRYTIYQTWPEAIAGARCRRATLTGEDPM